MNRTGDALFRLYECGALTKDEFGAGAQLARILQIAAQHGRFRKGAGVTGLRSGKVSAGATSTVITQEEAVFLDELLIAWVKQARECNLRGLSIFIAVAINRRSLYAASRKYRRSWAKSLEDLRSVLMAWIKLTANAA